MLFLINMCFIFNSAIYSRNFWKNLYFKHMKDKLKVATISVLLLLNSCNNSSKKNEHISLFTCNSLQSTAVDLMYSGDNAASEIIFELKTIKGSEQEVKRSKLTYIAEIQSRIDKESWDAIHIIETLKLKLLQASNQNLNLTNGAVIWEKDHNGKRQMQPFSIDFEKIKNLTDSKSVIKILSQPSLDSLWNELQRFRSNIIYHTGTYEWSKDSKFYTKDVKINSFKSATSLRESYKKQMGNHINIDEDQQLLIDLYVICTYPEKINEQSWMNYHFIGSSLIDALNVLTTLEINILRARQLAIKHWNSKVSTCSYRFDKILTIIDGPSAGKPGDTLKFKAFFGAVDSYNNPMLEIKGLASEIVYDQGAAHFRVLIPKDKQTFELSGQLSIKNKSGQIKTEEWKHTIHILE